MRFALSLLAFITLLPAVAQPELEAHYKAKTQILLESKKLLAKNSGQQESYNVVYHRLALDLNPDIAVPTVKGVVTTYFEPLVNNFQVFAFSLRCEMIVDSVEFHGQFFPANCANDIFTVSLPVQLSKGVLDSVKIHYHGIPLSRPGFTRTQQPSAPVIWTFSEPYYAADWWPCKMTLTDKIDSIDIVVRTPAAYRVASNGILAAEYSEGSNKVFFWKHRYPIAAYLVAIAITDYAVFSEYARLRNGDSIEILNYVYPVSLANAKTEVPKLKPVMRLYDSLFAGYPFKNEKYGHAQYGLGGGMEHQTMSFMTSYNYDLMAHELAHQWFGDKITCGTWADLWLNEGFATYLNGLAYNFLFPKSTWTQHLNGWINDITSQSGGSVFVSDTTNISKLFDQRLTYKKGAMLLHMLRWKLGDSSFFAAVRNYITDPFLEYRFAKTADLKKKLEEAAAENLDEFFADWYYGQGYPNYIISWKQEGSKISVNLQQKPSHPGVSFFEIPVPLKMKNGTRDTIVVINPQQGVSEYKFFISFFADSLLFDPDRWILAKSSVFRESHSNKPHQLILYPNPVDYNNPSTPLSIRTVDIQMDQFDIYDMQGRHLLTHKPDAPFMFYELDLAPFSRGIYFIQVRSGQVSISEKFIRL